MRDRICFMICSTLTESDRTLRSAMLCACFVPAAAGELRRFLDAHRQDAERFPQRAHAGSRDFGALVGNYGVAAAVALDVFPVPEQASPGAAEYFLHHLLCQDGVPEAVVIHDARDVGPGREYRLQRPFDRFLERSPVDLVLHPGGERHLLERAVEVPVLSSG